MSFDMKYNRDGQPITPISELGLEPQITLTPKITNIQEPEAQDSEQHMEATELQEQVENSNASEVIVTQEPSETLQQKNFRSLRQAKEQIERERDEALRIAQEMQLRLQNQTQPNVSKEDDDIHLNPDDIAEGKHLSKVAQKIKRLEDQLKGYQQQSNEVVIESRLKNECPDFDKVVSRDNIEHLKLAYPELLQSLQSTQDLYTKGKSAYTLIKKLGIYQEDTFMNERAKAQQNSLKPKPLASVTGQQSDSPLTKANAFAGGLTDELKAQLVKEMYAARKSM
jgi:hypothetical protein